MQTPVRRLTRHRVFTTVTAVTAGVWITIVLNQLVTEGNQTKMCLCENITGDICPHGLVRVTSCTIMMFLVRNTSPGEFFAWLICMTGVQFHILVVPCFLDYGLLLCSRMYLRSFFCNNILIWIFQQQGLGRACCSNLSPTYNNDLYTNIQKHLVKSWF